MDAGNAEAGAVVGFVPINELAVISAGIVGNAEAIGLLHNPEILDQRRRPKLAACFLVLTVTLEKTFLDRPRQAALFGRERPEQSSLRVLVWVLAALSRRSSTDNKRLC